MPLVANIIILAIVFVTIGFIGGAMVGIWASERDSTSAKKDAKEKARLQKSSRAVKSQPEPDSQADAEPQPEGELQPAALQQPEISSEPFALGPKKEGIHFWHEMRSGRLMVQWEGEDMPDPAAIPDDARRRMVSMARELIAWMGGVVEMPTRPPLLDVRREMTREMAPEPPFDTPPETDSEAVQVFELKEAIPPVEPDGLVVSYAASTPEKPGKKKAGAEKQAPPLSIVQQIDAVLQELLDISPLPGRGIKLLEDGRQGVVVWVGNNRYTGIDTVTDPEAKDMIRKAVSEWERRTERGQALTGK